MIVGTPFAAAGFDPGDGADEAGGIDAGRGGRACVADGGRTPAVAGAWLTGAGGRD